jgi:cytochrome c551/c552
MKNIIILFFLSVLITSCNQSKKKTSSNDSNSEVSKLTKDDPFSKSTVESKFFNLSTDKDTIIEGKNGTIIQIPKGAFKDAKGNVITGNVEIELAEPETLDEFLLSGISSQFGDKLLNSKGTFFINAKQNGKQLFLDENNPIYIEKPIKGKKEGDLRIFNGEKREDGQIEWTESTKAEKFLIPIDLELLDFLPKYFANEVEKGMPFRSYQSASKKLIDSLYYSLDNIQRNFPTQNPIVDFNIDTTISDNQLLDELTEESLSDTLATPCGINPSEIKTIKSKRFNNTLIATREFEKRLIEIFKSCENSLIKLYVENSDKNLWEIDEMAANQLGEAHPQFSSFKNFSSEKLTKIEKSESAKKLSKYYQNQLLKVKEELNKLKVEAEKDLKQKRAIAENKRQEYHELLKKREKYRMDKFGFKLTTFGWKRGAVYVEDLEKFVLEIKVNNGDSYDRVHTYIINNKIRSLFSMISNDNVIFNRGYNMDKHLLMWNDSKADAVVIAYKKENIFFGKQEFTASTKVPALLTFDLESISNANLKYKLRGDFWRKYENDVKVDLAFQELFAKERKRQKRLANERLFISKLKEIAFTCCEKKIDGEALFKSYCTSCHSANYNQLIGPGLAGTTSKYDLDWIIAFTKNSRKLVYEDKDPIAIRVYEEYNKVIMPAQPVTDKEVIAIFEYIDSLE